MLNLNRWKVVRVSIAVGLVLLGAVITAQRETMQPLNVAYYLRPEFKSDGPFLDPFNLETTQEYYLLENLASSLLLQRPSDGEKFTSHLLQGYSVLPDEIVLKPKADSRWSDGTKIKCEEIVASLRRSLSSPSRHIVELKGAKISCGAEDTISIRKRGLTVASALHELSLADLAVIKDTEEGRSFKVTSGAYFVADEDRQSNSILIERNRFHPTSTGSIEKIRILNASTLAAGGFELTPGTVIPGFGEIDFYAPQGWGFLPFTARAIFNAPEKVEGRFAMIHFLYLKKGDLNLARVIANRIGFARAEIEPPSGAKTESQLVPVGYGGRVQGDISFSRLEVLKREVLVHLDLLPGHQKIREYFEQLFKSAFGEKSPVRLVDSKEADVIFGSSSFKGNMSDPLGTFSFLLAPPHGVLSAVGGVWFEKLSGRKVSGSDIESIHRGILDSGLAIPLFSEKMMFLMGKRVLISEYNPFDMRVRFYDLRIR